MRGNRRVLTMKYKTTLLLVFMLLIGLQGVLGLPMLMDEQGILRNATSGALITGTYTFNTTIYNSSNDVVVYSESQSIAVSNGVWNNHIGLISPLSAAYFTSNTYIITRINSEALTRVNLTAVPYAFQSLESNNSAYLGGVAAASYATQAWVALQGYSTTSGSQWNISGSHYLYNNSGILSVNETALNDTIDARATGITIGDINITGYTLTTSFLNGVVGSIDMRGNPWYISGTNVELVGNMTAHNFYGNLNASYILNAPWGTAYTAGTGITLAGAAFSLNTTYTDTIYAKLSGIDGSNITAGTVADARIASTITRDTEVPSLINNTGTYNISITGLAGTATALASDPGDCAGNTWATNIAASGTLTCNAINYAGITAMTAANFNGLISDADPLYTTSTWTGGDLSGTGLAATIAANSVALTTDTTGNYVGTVAAGTGMTVTGADAENATKTVALNTTYTDTLYATIAQKDAVNATAVAALPKAGGTMTGNIAMGNNNATGVGCIVFTSGGKICTG